MREQKRLIGFQATKADLTLLSGIRQKLKGDDDDLIPNAVILRKSLRSYARSLGVPA